MRASKVMPSRGIPRLKRDKEWWRAFDLGYHVGLTMGFLFAFALWLIIVNA